jgi:hypothetical protein
MSDSELRIECLRLAQRGHVEPPEKTVERAEAFYRFARNEGPVTEQEASDRPGRP